MGILNVTPDSFSDGGRFDAPDTAIAHGYDLMEQGADIIDVGGQSTRPGAPNVSAKEECERIMPAVQALIERGAIVSVDTIHAETAIRVAQVGAHIINDVSGGTADPDMPAAVAQTGLPYICQHWRGNPQTMDQLTDYPDGVSAGVCTELDERLRVLDDAGVDLGRVILDPGLGFAKTGDQNWQLVHEIDQLMAMGYPVLVGASRKRFLTQVTGDIPADQRDMATAAISAFVAAHGVWGVRVHDVASSLVAVRTVARTMGA